MERGGETEWLREWGEAWTRGGEDELPRVAAAAAEEEEVDRGVEDRPVRLKARAVRESIMEVVFSECARWPLSSSEG